MTTADRRSASRSMIMPARRSKDRWFDRIGNEVYVGAMVVGLLAVAVGMVALLVRTFFGVSRWVQLGE